MHPRLRLDIGWRDLAFAMLARRPGGPAAPGAVVGLSVRTLWDALLGELALPAGSKVILSGVNVEGVIQIVRAHGLTPVSIDLDLATLAPDLEALDSAAASGRARVFLLAHLYGARLDAAPYAAVCRRRGLLLVEDRAQAFDGRLIRGEGADVTLFSFGPIKSCTALGGAVALTADPDLAKRLQARLGQLTPLTQGWFRRRVVRFAALKLLSTSVLYGLLWRGLQALGRDPDRLVSTAVRGFRGDLLRAVRRAPPPALLALLDRRLAHARPPEVRVALARTLVGRLGADYASPGAAAPNHGWWVTPVLSPAPDELVARLRRHGFDATRGATSLRAVADAAGRVPARAARLMEEVVYLPLPRTARQARRLAALMLGSGSPRPGRTSHLQGAAA